MSDLIAPVTDGTFGKVESLSCRNQSRTKSHRRHEISTNRRPGTRFPDYQLLGRILEQQRKYTEAIALYQQFLKMSPDAIEAPAIQSFITQLQKQLEEQ